jgi:hypothetical protein
MDPIIAPFRQPAARPGSSRREHLSIKLRAPLILFVTTALFHWRILFTRQFSMLVASEGVNQAYSWYTFWISTIRRGIFPLWDPYTFGGHPFAGEMQTAAFYPLNFLLALFPFGHNGYLSEPLYHVTIALTRFAGAYFMYLLARELEMVEFPALLAGICFSFGGVLGHVSGWPHLMQSGTWLPLIFLFLLRALHSRQLSGTVCNALLCALFMGLSILAGGLHFVMMQFIIVVSAGAFYAWNSDRGVRIRAGIAVAIACTAGFAVGAVQLFPSYEYSQISLRWIGAMALPANQKIPYFYLTDKLYPESFVHLLLPQAFGGQAGDGEVVGSYAGVLPLLLAAIGIWSRWGNLWVRYLAGLALAGFIYSLGDFSFLHGLLYALVPDLWMAREAPRFMYLASFGLAIFTGFGTQTIFSEAPRLWRAENLTRILNWTAIACAVALAVRKAGTKPMERIFYSADIARGGYLPVYSWRPLRSRRASSGAGGCFV